ncbi:MAG: PHP domain-containing protein [Clostridia bacterium]|nr:PHP domain-containing protein [Clostridia bacterium]
MTADLHCHTRLSDGTLGIDDIVILAKKSGISTIAITDHDSLAGTVRGKIIGERYGVTVIPGVEISATDSKRGTKAHILCYLPEKPDRLEGLCRRNSQARKRASQFMLLKTAQKYPITPEFVIKCASGSTNIFKQHIMQALLESGYTTTIYGELYDRLFSKDSPDNVLTPATYPEPAQIINDIHEAGGIAVLAHPGFYDNFELLEELIPLGLDGVEVWHPENTPEQQKRLIEIAKKHKLLVTGGTDFHGAYNAKPIRIGDYGVEQDMLDALISYKAKLRRQQKRLAAQQEAAVK